MTLEKDNNDSSHDGVAPVGDSVPVAIVTPRRNVGVDFVSKAWLIPIAALMIAVGLVWWSLPASGISIRIHFPEGHGLQEEDVVRFRGIDVGVVRKVELNAALSGVDVDVQLKPFAEKIARVGTRFWVVRPELSLTEISGLETAVGHKYIGVLPGEPEGEFQFRFEGLSESPPDADAEDGFEIIIRGDERFSINPGSPVTCRGVEVGRVLSVGLSQNARFVDVRARVYDKYRNFLNSETRFWASSGVNFDFSIGGGLKLEAESLETIAKGGVSFLTTSADGAPVQSGQVFKLYSAPEDDWLEQAENVRINNIQLGFAVPLEAKWEQKGLFRKSEKTITFVGVPILNGEKYQIVVPSDVLRKPEKAIAGTFEIRLQEKKEMVFADGEAIEYALRSSEAHPWLTRINLDVVQAKSLPIQWASGEKDIRPTTPEDCLAVRASGQLGAFEFLHYAIDKDLLFEDRETGQLVLRFFDGDQEIWHGAPVQSVKDGKLIGTLLTNEKRTTIVPFRVD